MWNKEQFKEWRASMGYTQGQAAEALGITRQTITQYEGGHKDIDKRTALACQHLAHLAGAQAKGLRDE